VHDSEQRLTGQHTAQVLVRPPSASSTFATSAVGVRRVVPQVRWVALSGVTSAPAELAAEVKAEIDSGSADGILQRFR